MRNWAGLTTFNAQRELKSDSESSYNLRFDPPKFSNNFRDFTNLKKYLNFVNEVKYLKKNFKNCLQNVLLQHPSLVTRGAQRI